MLREGVENIVSSFNIVELAADQNSDPLARNPEISNNRNLYKVNLDLNFSVGHQNVTKLVF